MQKLRVSCACPPNFMRGVMTIGGLRCLFDHGIRPEMITGCSAGALAALSSVEWNRNAMDKALDAWSNLTPGRISKARLGDKVFLAAALFGALLHLAPTRKDSFWTHAVRAALALGIPAAALHLMLSQSSLFSSDPLGELLAANLHFDNIRRSRVKLAIVSAEHQTGERLVHTNFLPKDDKEGLLLNASLSTSAIPVIFSPRVIEGRIATDGARARKDPIAIDYIEEYTESDRIFVFLHYWLPAEEYHSTVLSNLDHDNELVVRDKLESTLVELSASTKKKIVLVLADEPPKKVGLHNFTKNDLAVLIEKGYRSTERMLYDEHMI